MSQVDQEALRRARNEEARHISLELKDRVRDLAPVLLPEGSRQGREWRAGSKGGRSIVLEGPNRGVYRDFERSDRGCDMLAAVSELLCNGSLREAIAWSKSWLGMSGMDAGALELARQRAEERAKKDAEQSKKDTEKRKRQASGIWHGAGPLAGSLADEYLKEARGIDIRRLPRPPSALRYSSEVWCKERRSKHPAMVSSLWRLGEPKMVAVHRTYIDRHPDGVDKAKVEAPRSILGSWPGAIIPIQRGETGARWKDIEEGELVAFGEGIEEGLSVALVKPTWRVGAVGFVGNFSEIQLPVWCHVVLCANNDPPGSEAAKAIEKAEAKLKEKDHLVLVARPPAEFKDWNDFLRGISRDK